MPNHSIRKKSGHIITIDEKHNMLLEEFDKIDTETIPEMEIEREDLRTKLKQIDDEKIDEKMEIKDKISDIN